MPHTRPKPIADAMQSVLRFSKNSDWRTGLLTTAAVARTPTLSIVLPRTPENDCGELCAAVTWVQ